MAIHFGFRQAQCLYWRIGGLAHSQYTKGVGTYRDPETQVVRLDRLHCWLPPDFPPPEIKRPLCFYHSGRALPMDLRGHGMERGLMVASSEVDQAEQPGF